MNLHVFGYNARWGYRTDTQTGLFYCQNRYYSASDGRWLNRDPIGYCGGTNLYGFCGNGPVGGMDPSGFKKTGSYFGDVGQVFVGYGNFIAKTVSSIWEDPGGFDAMESLVTDPVGTAKAIYNSVNFWDTDDPTEFGEKFTPWIPVIAEGACSAKGMFSKKPPVSNTGAVRYHSKTGVPFDADGYPIFDAEADVTIEPTGDRKADVSAANKAAGYEETPDGKTWHHHQDRGRMQLVDREIHKRTGHKGGWSIWGKGLP